MRIFLFTIAGLPFLLLDGLLLYTLPFTMARHLTRHEGMIVSAGALSYLIVHYCLRKPERMYLWAHEFSHLLIAKIFMKKVHSFHISSRDGGKVVIEGTNVMIDLAPYILPLYAVGAGALAFILKSSSPWIPQAYLGLASFLFSMHLVFSVEGFVNGQPDLKRSGRIFSAGVVFLCLLLWIPCLAAPGAESGWKGAASAYRGWAAAAEHAGRRLSGGLLNLF